MKFRFCVVACALTLIFPGVSTQSISSIVSTNWTSVGCFTDISTSRTLTAISVVRDLMTIETCVNICGAADYIFAGVEFGSECYCDSALQIPSQAAPVAECNIACSGNANETCGGANRLNIFNNGKPPPVIVQSVNTTTGMWHYQGCFTDSTAARTLRTGVNIPGGTTAESCTAACAAADGFVNAGLEDGHECWCDNVINNPAQRTSDNDCRMVCQATHTEFCGNANRVAVYHFSNTGTASGSTPCLLTGLSDFKLVAQFKNPPTTGPSFVDLKVVVVEMSSNIIWTVLSVCPTCCSEWPSFTMENSIVFPKSSNIVAQVMSSTAPRDGESPNFVASIPAFPGSQSYCTMQDVAGATGNPPLLAFGGKSDAFSVCKNNTANGRLDLVFSPVTGHPHYSLAMDCSPVSVQVIVS